MRFWLKATPWHHWEPCLNIIGIIPEGERWEYCWASINWLGTFQQPACSCFQWMSLLRSFHGHAQNDSHTRGPLFWCGERGQNYWRWMTSWRAPSSGIFALFAGFKAQVRVSSVLTFHRVRVAAWLLSPARLGTCALARATTLKESRVTLD